MKPRNNRTPDERADLHHCAEQHGAMVFRLALRVVRNRADAEDVTQEVFVKLVEARRRANVQEPRGWLAITALNTARNHLRNEKNRRRRQEVFAERAMRERGNGGSTNQGTPTQESTIEESAVWAAVDTLPVELRFPLLLHYQEGLKYREIADALRCPPGTVATRISQAKSKVQSILERNGALKP